VGDEQVGSNTMAEIINIKHISKSLELYNSIKEHTVNIAYCGLSYTYWARIFPIIQDMENYSILGKPRELIVKGNRPLTIDRYRLYLKEKTNKNYPHRGYVEALRALRTGHYNYLACWCEPKLCHLSVIIEAFEWDIYD